MAVKTKFRLTGPGRDSYLELVMAFPLASIQSDEHLHVAQKVMDQLLAQGVLDEGEEMYLDALSDLVAAYEDEHYGLLPSGRERARHKLLTYSSTNPRGLSGDMQPPSGGASS